MPSPTDPCPAPAPARSRQSARDLRPGDRISEPYTRPGETVAAVWRDDGVDALICVMVREGNRVLYLHPDRRVLA